MSPTDIVYITGDSIVGESKMYWRKDGCLKFGSMNDLFKDFETDHLKHTFEVLSSIDKKVKGSEIRWFKIASVEDHGVRDVFEIIVSGGKSVEVTEDHSLFYSEGYQFYPAKFSMLKLGKRLVCSAKLDFFEGEEKNFEDFLFVLGGLWVADGSYYKTSIGISTGNNESIITFLQSIPRFLTKTERAARFVIANPSLNNLEVMKAIGETSSTVRNARSLLDRYAPRSDRVHVLVKKSGDAVIYNKGLQNKLITLGFEGNSYTKRVPSWIFSASKRQIGLFLRGYFSGDGSFHTKGDNRVVVEASSVNKALLRDIQTLLERIGVQGTIGTGHYRQKNGFATVHRQYKLVVERKGCIENFLKNAGLIYPVRKDLLLTLEKQKSIELNDFMTRTIKEIKNIGKKRVYDICVPKSECFIANGILCHNSGSGKSVLLRAIRSDLGEEAIDLTEVDIDPDKPLIETVGATVE